MRRRRGTRAPCHRIASNVTPTAPSALYATRGGGPGGLTIIAILDLLGGAAQCMVAAGPMHGIQLPATDACKCMALYGGLWGGCAELGKFPILSQHAAVAGPPLPTSTTAARARLGPLPGCLFEGSG